jgi:hypothetical protein
MELSDAQIEQRGAITWLSSDEDGGPDCGIVVGLGDGRSLHIGEISRHLWEQAGGLEMGLGEDYGHWIVLFGPNETLVIGRASEELDLNDTATLLASLLDRK